MIILDDQHWLGVSLKKHTGNSPSVISINLLKNTSCYTFCYRLWWNNKTYSFLDPRTLPEIQESIRLAIEGNITLFSLAFGNDANYGFLDTLSKQNNGIVRRIYEDSDAPLQLKVANWVNVVSAK